MTILLTGATGFIGTNFILQLYKKYNIIALVRKSSNISRIEKFCKIYYYEDINSLRNILLQEKIHGVIHLATLYLKKS
ncbi:NAD-dependent epimerase/dehydratase family protein [Campylobacter jejuni]|nr:NAD-dependent epimerase/dehydratase family protein [Campylobacter jejuni]